MSDDGDSLIMPNYGEINGNLEENPENQFAATEDVIKSKLRQIGCHYVGTTITSYTYKAPNGKHFHIPKALGGKKY